MGRVIIANSLSEHDLDSLEVGLNWSKNLKLSPYVIHADKLADYNSLDPVFAHLNIDIHQEYIDNILKGNEKRLIKQIEKIDPDFEKFEYDSLAGSAIDVIARESKKNDTELVVMGRRKDKTWAEAFMGSVSEGVLHRSHCSVLIAKNTKLDSPKKIMVAYDFSKLCDSALNWSKKLADTYGCEVHVVNIVPCYYEGYHVAHTMRSDFNAAIESMIDESVGKIEERLNNKMGTFFTDQKIVPKVLIDKDGSIAQCLINYSEEIGADLLLLGSHQRSKLAEFFLGAISTRIAKKAKTSVLIAK